MTQDMAIEVQTWETLFVAAWRLVKRNYAGRDKMFRLLRADSRFSFFGDPILNRAIDSVLEAKQTKAGKINAVAFYSGYQKAVEDEVTSKRLSSTSVPPTANSPKIPWQWFVYGGYRKPNV